MSVTCTEKINGRNIIDGVSKSATISYILQGIKGESDTFQDLEDAAHAALLATSPETWPIGGSDVPRQSRQIEDVFVDENGTRAIWEGTVTYSFQTQRTAGNSVYQFDTGGHTEHVNQSIATVNKYAPTGETAPDHNRAIGVSGDNIQGVDVPKPSYNFSEVHYMDDTTVNSLKSTWADLTGSVNSSTFAGFPAGEVLFQGASGTKRGNAADWEITFKFSRKPNATGLSVGNITGIEKKGWDYLWVQYENAEDATAKRIKKIPMAVYVEQVLPTGDLNNLGI